MRIELRPPPTAGHDAGHQPASGWPRAWLRLSWAGPANQIELLATILAALYFFLLLGGYFILRPLRETMGLAGGVKELSWLYLGTLVATLAINPLFAALVNRYPRRVFVPAAYHVFAAMLLAFLGLLYFAPAWIDRRVGSAFYVWLSVFNMFVVSVFWGYLSDGFSFEQSRRLYGLIGVGGTLGAITGAAVTEWLSKHGWSAVALMLLAFVVLEGATACTYLLGSCFRRMRGQSGAAQPPPPESARPAARTTGPAEAGIQPSIFSGLTAVVRSPFLLMICGYIVLVAISATILYFVQALIVSGAAVEPAERTAVFARIDKWTQMVTLVTQTLITAYFLRRGAGAALAFYPLLTIAGLGVLYAAPTLAAIMVVQVFHRGMHHALARPARETLFTVVSRDEKYKAKNIIDTFVYRGGDLLGALIFVGLTQVSLNLGGVFWCAVPIVVVWIAVAVLLGRIQTARARVLETDQD